MDCEPSCRANERHPHGARSRPPQPRCRQGAGAPAHSAEPPPPLMPRLPRHVGARRSPPARLLPLPAARRLVAMGRDRFAAPFRLLGAGVLPLKPAPPELRTRRLRRCSALHRCTTCCKTWSAPPSPRSCPPVSRHRWRVQRPPLLRRRRRRLLQRSTVRLCYQERSPGRAPPLPRPLSRRRRSWMASARHRQQAATSQCAQQYRRPPRP